LKGIVDFSPGKEIPVLTPEEAVISEEEEKEET